MTPALNLFARRGIAEPIRRQEHPAHIRGREDCVYGRGWHRAFSNPEWQDIYDAAWRCEMAEADSASEAENAGRNLRNDGGNSTDS